MKALPRRAEGGTMILQEGNHSGKVRSVERNPHSTRAMEARRGWQTKVGLKWDAEKG